MPEPEQGPVRAVTETQSRRRVSAVWIVPVVAALAGAWIAVTTWLDKGPEIRIEFRTGEGLEAGKTKIKYKGVEIGVLTAVHLEDELVVHGVAQMEPGTEKLLLEDSRFWVVKPRINGANISGLGTLVSGSYIAVDLGTGETHGKEARHFTALKTPPVVYADVQGTFFTLETPTLGSLDSGTPIFYRRLQVGEVSSYEMDEAGQMLKVRIYVEAPYDRFVKAGTRFWQAGGVDVSLSAAGLSVQTQSLLSVLVGGIAFETASVETAEPPAAEDTVFPLFENRAAAFRPPVHDPQSYRLVFRGSVRGLAPGAPVEFRGIPIGEVESVDAHLDQETWEFEVPVTIRLDARRLGVDAAAAAGNDAAEWRRRLLDNLVARGVRAQLRSGSLLTGALYVAFESFPSAPPAAIDWTSTPPELPTMPGQLDALEASVSKIVARLDQLPLDEIGRDLQRTIQEMDRTLVSAQKALDSAQQALNNTGQLVAPESTLRSELSATLGSVNDAARSVRVLADYLERHPESLLRGKTGDAK